MRQVRRPPGSSHRIGETPSVKSKDKIPCMSYLDVHQLQLEDGQILSTDF